MQRLASFHLPILLLGTGSGTMEMSPSGQRGGFHQRLEHESLLAHTGDRMAEYFLLVVYAHNFSYVK
ncbi:MAG: hypothetical protein N838_31690 [Thiohalocapsa sp. PB-PSB1]|nr:MAG: hypothetical protein N838_31690 [Thiohalocapsa sp. PB-PSB1]